MNKLAQWFVAVVLGVVLVLPAHALQSPLEMVKSTSDQVLEQMADREAELKESPGKIYELVEHIVLPRFDFKKMSKLVLGKYWRKAKPAEIEAFVNAFRELLVRTYATALLSYSGQEIVYLPSHNAENAKEAKVDTKVAADGAAPIPITYSLYLDGEEWKVFDVSIDGVSLVSNYRTSFSTQIRRYKLSGLIKKLEKRNMRDK